MQARAHTAWAEPALGEVQGWAGARHGGVLNSRHQRGRSPPVQGVCGELCSRPPPWRGMAAIAAQSLRRRTPRPLCGMLKAWKKPTCRPNNVSNNLDGLPPSRLGAIVSHRSSSRLHLLHAGIGLGRTWIARCDVHRCSSSSLTSSRSKQLFHFVMAWLLVPV